MITKNQIIPLIKAARSNAYKRNFKQSFELIITLKDIDFKKQNVSINEVIQLPFYSGQQPKICFICGGDLALRAKKAGVDLVIEQEQLDKLQGNKKEVKRLSKEYDFFFAEPTMMARIGKVFGQFLGPTGKMPTPVPPNMPIENMITKFRNSVRARTRSQLSVATKVGSEELEDEQVAENILAVYNTIERKLPQGEKNIKKVYVKLTMSKPLDMLVGVKG
ncbi:MAG: 50S ribosomal protein L1 [Nitrososphaeria archaeon]